MSRGERIVDALLLAYFGAVFTLMLLPLLLFAGLLWVADWIDEWVSPE